MAIQFLERPKPTLLSKNKSLGLFTFILFSNEVLTSTTAYASDQLVQEVSLKTKPVSETLSTKNASLEVVHQESTVDDPQSSKAGDPPVAATADESVAVVNDKKTSCFFPLALSSVSYGKPSTFLEASPCL